MYSWLWQGVEIQFDLASHALEAQQGRTIIIKTWLLFFICSHFYLVGWLWSGMFKVQLTCSTVSGVEISSPLRIMDRCVRTSATWSEFSPKSSDVQLSAANKWNTPLTTLDVKCHFKWRKPWNQTSCLINWSSFTPWSLSSASFPFGFWPWNALAFNQPKGEVTVKADESLKQSEIKVLTCWDNVNNSLDPGFVCALKSEYFTLNEKFSRKVKPN